MLPSSFRTLYLVYTSRHTVSQGHYLRHRMEIGLRDGKSVVYPIAGWAVSAVILVNAIVDREILVGTFISGVGS
jgi:hypothetical protein